MGRDRDEFAHLFGTPRIGEPEDQDDTTMSYRNEDTSSSSSEESSSSTEPIVPTEIWIENGRLNARFLQHPGVSAGELVRIGPDGKIDMEALWTEGQRQVRPIGWFRAVSVSVIRVVGSQGVHSHGVHPGEEFQYEVEFVADDRRPDPEDLRRQIGQRQWLERSLIRRYTQESYQEHHLIPEAGLWDELAVEYPKFNERRRVIKKILELRRDRIEESERQERIKDLQIAEQVKQAEEVLRKAAERAAASGQFSKPTRQIRLCDE